MNEHACLTVEDRLAAPPLSRDQVESLFDFYMGYEPGFSPSLNLGWDIRRHLGEPGFDLWFDQIWTFEPPLDAAELLPGDQRLPISKENYETRLRETWASYDRPNPKPGDILLIDAMSEARSEGWQFSDQMESTLNSLRTLSDEKKAAAEAAKEAAIAAEDQAHRIKLQADNRRIAQLFESARRAVARFSAIIPTDTFSPTGQVAFDSMMTASPESLSRYQMLTLINYVNDCLEAHNMKNEYETLPCAVKLSAQTFEMEVRRAIDAERPPGFIYDSKGNKADPLHPSNVRAVLHMNLLAVRENVWSDRLECRYGDADWKPLSDKILDDLMTWASGLSMPFNPSKEFFRRTVASSCRENSQDSLLDRLNSLEAAWDGIPRLDSWLHRACHVPDDAYHRAVGSNIIGGMVTRARIPGVEHPECAILISSEQGTGKSTITKILALEKAWHTDSLKLGGRQQDMIPQMSGKWICELSELSGMNKTEVEDVKVFISSTSDNYTRKYDAFATDQPRRCIFIGTSNSEMPLRDPSGGRRFLPVRVQGHADLEWLRDNVELLIGEAASRQACGETFGIPKELWAAAAQHQEAALQRPEYEIILSEWLAPTGLPVFVTAADLSQVVREAAGRPVRAIDYTAFIRKLGFDDKQKKVSGKNINVWVRGNPKDAYQIEPKAAFHQQRGVKHSLTVDELPSPPLPPIPQVGGRR